MYIFYKKGRRKPNKISETRRTTVTVKITREKKKSHNGNEHRAGNKKAASKTTFSHSQRVEKREVNHQLQKQEKEAHTYTLHMAHSLRSYTPQCSTALLLLLSPYKCQRVRSVIPERIHGALIRKVKPVAGELFYSGKLAPTHPPHGGSSSSSSSSSVRIMEQRARERKRQGELASLLRISQFSIL